jgi:RNA recognition motif-containing protein
MAFSEEKQLFDESDGRTDIECGIFVSSIPNNMGDIDLKKAFENYGPVARANVSISKKSTEKSKQGKNFGFVFFTDKIYAERLLESHDYIQVVCYSVFYGLFCLLV